MLQLLGLPLNVDPQDFEIPIGFPLDLRSPFLRLFMESVHFFGSLFFDMTLFCFGLLSDGFNLLGLVGSDSRNFCIDFLVFGTKIPRRGIFELTSPSLEILELIEHPPLKGGMDALNNLGAGGAAEPYAVLAANALVYGLFFLICIAAGANNSRIGLKWGFALGSIENPIYGAGLYVNSTSAVSWFMLFSRALYGIPVEFQLRQYLNLHRLHRHHVSRPTHRRNAQPGKDDLAQGWHPCLDH